MDICANSRRTAAGAYRALRLPAAVALAAWLGLPPTQAFAVDCDPVTDGATLAAEIADVNAGTCDTINITGAVSLSSQNLPIIDRAGATITIQGDGGVGTVDGTGTSRLFAVVNGDVTIRNVNIENGLAKGGDGGSNSNGGGGAGGALGAGGGLFIGAGGTVTLEDVDLLGNTAQGGAGGNSAAGGWGAGAGGGGLNGGAGGSGAGAIVGASGGGGAFGADGGGNATSRGGSGGGGGGNNAAAGSQGTSFSGASGGTGAGGAGGAGGNGDDPDPGADGTGMGGGGGGGSANNYTSVGDGGDGGALGGGGGGGGQAHFVTGMNGTGDGGAGGDGGFGGGGGGGGASFQNSAGTWTSGTGGLGGFGAGGGGGGAARAQSGTPTMVAGSGSAGGVLGGDGGDGAVYIAGGGGGGGAGLGGAIFVQNGGTLNIGQNVTFGGAGANNVAGGAGGSSSAGTAGTAGGAAGANIYAIDGAAGLGSNATVGFHADSAKIELDDSALSLLQAGYSDRLRKTGAEEVELTASTGLTTGGWLIAAGILRGTTDNLLGDLTADGTLIIDQNSTGTLAGDITGSGSLVKESSGNVTLSGNNDAFTGSVQIDGGILNVNGSGLGDTSAVTLGAGGTLAIGAAGETIGSLTGSGDVSLGGSLVVGGTFHQAVFSGDISGSGSLTKSGAGTLYLTGMNSYTGGTTIDAGTLNGMTSSLIGDIVNNSALVFAQTFDGTYAGDISGSGSLTKAGNGTLTLSGNNSYSGGTTITTGTLRGTTSNVVGDVVNNSTLEFDQATNGTHNGDISGSGALVKSGSGTVTLSGTNSYSGGTTIAAGTLRGTTLSLVGDIVNDGTVEFDQAFDGTYADAISGSGGLTKSGSGTMTLSGNNSYSGGTTIAAGTLRGTTSSLTGNIANNSALEFDQAGNGTFAGQISGSGSLTKSGSGNVTLSGNNDAFTGSVDIDGGTLSVNGSGIGDTSAVTVGGSGTLAIGAAGETIGSLAGSGGVSLGGALDVGGNNTTTVFSGDISGSGSLTKSGTGNLILSGTNSYTGGTTIDAGTLIGMTSSLTGDIVNNSALIFAQNTDGTHSGDISGSGGLVKSGGGTVTLSGTNSYSGGTTIAAGTLAGTTLSLMGDILNNGTLQFDQTFDGTYADDISGSGGLVKAGSGTLNLSGSNTYSGTTTVSAGALSVNGTLASDVTVATGATLQGIGSVGSTTVNGLLAPGNSIGTLSVVGNLDLTPSSVFEVEFDDAGNADKVTITGTASLDGTLRLAPEAGTYANGMQYTILEAATVTGQFANTTVTNEIRLAGLSATITYEADEVQMALSKASFGGGLGSGSGFGSGPVADYLDEIRPGISGELEDDVGALAVLPLEELDAALQALSPQVADAVPQVQNAFGRVVTDAMEVRLDRLRIAELRQAGQPSAGFMPQLAAAAVATASARDEPVAPTHSVGSLELPASKSWEDQFLAVAAPDNNAASLFELGNQTYTAWAQLLGEFGSRASDGDLLGYDYRVFGITSGLEQQVTPQLDLGALVAVGYSEVDFDRDRGANTEQTYSAGAYLGWMPAPGVTIDLTGWGGLSQLDGERNIRFSGMDRTAESDTNVYSLGVDLRGEYIESWRNFRLGAFGGVGFLSNWQEDYCETGAGALNLCVDDANTQQLRGELGLSATYDVELAPGNLMIDVELAATGTLPLDDRMIKSGFVSQEKTFLIPGDDREELGFAPRLEFTYQMQDDSELSISYSGQFTENLDAHGVQIGLRIPF